MTHSLAVPTMIYRVENFVQKRRYNTFMHEEIFLDIF